MQMVILTSDGYAPIRIAHRRTSEPSVIVAARSAGAARPAGCAACERSSMGRCKEHRKQDARKRSEIL